MPLTSIVECPNCKGFMLATATQKTKTCPYCGNCVDLTKSKRIAKAPTAMEASQMLRKLKAERQKNPKINPKN